MRAGFSYTPRWLGGLPLWVFLAVYFITCFLAAVPLAFDYRPLRVMVGYFAGVVLPEGFDPWSADVFWCLLVLAPLLMTIAYHKAFGAVVRRFGPAAARRAGEDEAYRAALLPVAGLFALGATSALLSLNSADAWRHFSAWWDYGTWVRVRWALYAELGYFEFVNIYVWLPLMAAWLAVVAMAVPRHARWTAAFAVLLTIAVTLMLYQKKALVAVLLLILFAMMLQRMMSGRMSAMASRMVLTGLTAVTLTYMAMTVVPVWRDTSSRLDQIEEDLKRRDPKAFTQDTLVSAEELAEVLGDSRAVHVAAYALLSPFTRTSLPSFYYAEGFPDAHPYFGLDLGQDILGIGSMPTDNRVVWDMMYPDLPGGAASASFQFVLYSQMGLAGGLIGAAVVGAALGAAWACLLTWRRDGPLRPVLGALLLLLAIYLAIDSPRNSLMASYGLLWGVGLAIGLWGLDALAGRRLRPQSPDPR